VKRIALLWVLVFIFFLVNTAPAQFLGAFLSGDDPDIPDTLYFEAGYPCSANGDTLFFPWGGGDVTIYINIWNDDTLKGISVPLVDLSYSPASNAYLDSAKNNGAFDPLCFVGSRVEHFGGRVCNLLLNPPRVLYGAVTVQSEPLLPGDGLFATMVYTVADTGWICLDTLWFPPANNLTFVYGLEPTGFTPQFVSRCFRLAPYLCGDANGDGIVDIVDVVYITNYLLKSGPTPVAYSDANCDGEVNIDDVVYEVNYVLKFGPDPCDPDDDGEPDC
jgi:hypothetical protein